MEHVITVTAIAKFLAILSSVAADTYSVKIGTESHVNLVDTKFLSFTIEPKYLFSSSGKYKSKECICMASSLTPAYIRIAGPSTSQMTFHNSTISIDSPKLLDDGNSPQKVSLNEYHGENLNVPFEGQLSVTHDDWKHFVQWAKKTGFDLVFALNNEEKTSNGMWDPNTALNILTVADKADIGDIFWQLGYACYNQSIEEYLNDLETLRVITETFRSGRSGHWRVVGGDVTPCLAADSKSDFKDYIALSDEMFDAVFLNGNSSSQEMERMSEKDRLKLLKVLSRSDTPLWLTETNHRFHELERATEWMTSLGYSAKNGFSVHFRELVETELYEPTLSFYMALLFKNLVGEKVLNVDIEAADATMFAHCTSLRHKPVPGAVTLYGANMDFEPARFSIKLSKKEEGGDIMQFILGHDHSGNIIVNGRAMYYEGDIKPVVKRVRPYKTLLINLPPKSFGFWVLANTQVEACYENDDKTEETQFVEALPSEDIHSTIVRSKRAVNIYNIGFNKESSIDFVELLNDTNLDKKGNTALKNIIHDLYEDLTSIQNTFPYRRDQVGCSKNHFKVVKRQAYDTEKRNTRRVKPNKRVINSRMTKQDGYHDNSLLNSKLFSKLNNRLNRLSKNDFSRLSKRNSKSMKPRKFYKKERTLDNKEKKTLRHSSVVNKNIPESKTTNPDSDSLQQRKRRSITEEKDIVKKYPIKDNRVGNNRLKNKINIEHSLEEVADDATSENEVVHSKDVIPIRKVLHTPKKVSRLPVEIYENNDADDFNENTSGIDEIVLRTKFFDDSAIINIKEKSKNGFLRSTIEEILSLLVDFNKNLNKAWSVLTLLESN